MAADGFVPDALAATRAMAFAALDRRLDRDSRAPLAVGLSGGGDSLALLLLALEWARPAGRRVLALTVDHGLNAESARWTAEAGTAARALGAEWRALAWRGAKPATGLPAAARRARHALLAEAARDAGASVLLLGHTAEDVAESEVIRRETPTHGRLRDWAPSPVWPEGRGVLLLRPLLEVRRAPLRALLAERGMAWLEDPANTDPAFARTRARRALSEMSDFPAPEVASATPTAAVQVEASSALTLALSPGAPISAIALARLIACASGRETPPSGSGVCRLLAGIGRGAGGTLGGARVAVANGSVRLCRELGRRPPAPLVLKSGEPVMFDGRFEVAADGPGWRVAALAGHAARLPDADRRRLAGISAFARPALPVMLGAEGETRLPRPLADGPGVACELVSSRLAAAFGRIDTERALALDLRASDIHGA